MIKNESTINSLRALKAVAEPDVLKKNDGFAVAPHALLEEEGFNTRGAFDAFILPDGDDYDVAEGMVRVFARHGFKPLKMDGEVYRKDVSFVPKGFKKTKSFVSSNLGVVNEQK